ncbi:hypothetical protein D3C87_27050 [compost metagenome]
MLRPDFLFLKIINLMKKRQIVDSENGSGITLLKSVIAPFFGISNIKTPVERKRVVIL